MKHVWAGVIILLGALFLLQQSQLYWVYSGRFVPRTAGSTIPTIPAVCEGASCSSTDIQTGLINLVSINPDSETNYTSCTNDSWQNWCCVCHQNYNLDICDPNTLTCPKNTPTPENTPTPRPVNCNWSTWSDCANDVNCGIGTRSHYPSPPASNGGAPCTGPASEQCRMPTPYCPIDCEWGAWSACSKTCDQGIRTRSEKTFAQYRGKACVGPRQETCNMGACSATGTGGFITGTTGNANNELQIFMSTLNASSITPTPGLLPTYTPVPTRGPTAIPPTPQTPTIFDNAGNIIPSPTPTNIPQIVRVSPTPTPRPSATPTPIKQDVYNPVAIKKEDVKDKTVTTLDIKKLTEIKIAPYTQPKIAPTDKPFLPQEQRKLALSEPLSVASGILVTLEQKIGDAFITRQDELTVKRGNQFFTISNQVSPGSNTQNKQGSGPSSTNASSAQLEINANNVIARSSMGLSVDPLSGILTVETPNGPQKVSIMPDEALGIVLELKALNAKGVLEPTIFLVSERGSLIYRISGEKVEKFLGLFPLSVKKQILISADTGSVVKVELSLLSQILSFFTF